MARSRAERLADRATESGCAAALVIKPADLRWLTGFTGTSGLALCGSNVRAFITDFRYTEQAAAEVEGFDVLICERELNDRISIALAGAGGRIAFDPTVLTVDSLDRLREALPDGWEAEAVKHLVSPLREVKDAGEIGSIAAAASLADEAFRRTLEAGLVGRTEAEVAWSLERNIRELGGEGVSFSPIVAAGAHGALPHASPRDVAIPEEVLVVIDWGAIVDGYCSDCTRTVATGEVGEEEAAVHGLVLEDQQAAVGALRPGPSGPQIDDIARGLIAQAGHGEHFGHGLGHGVGLEVHEGPTLGRSGGEAPLESGMVVTVEPGVYLPGRFGVRIEDLCVVAEGGPRILTGLERGMVVAG
ncbi:MAG: Xaa-Pro peptidase family protein [Actinomycetes bacterium]